MLSFTALLFFVYFLISNLLGADRGSESCTCVCYLDSMCACVCVDAFQFSNMKYYRGIVNLQVIYSYCNSG